MGNLSESNGIEVSLKKSCNDTSEAPRKEIKNKILKIVKITKSWEQQK